jgi:hypothetical protein
MYAYPAKWLTGLGLVLIALAIALVMYNPGTGAIGYYPKAITGGAIGGGLGLAALICGLLTRAGKRPALWAGLLVCLLAMAGFFMQAKKFVRLAQGPEPTKAYSATIVSLMCAASFLSLINVGLGARRLPPTDSH